MARGLNSRDAVEQYLGPTKVAGQSSRSMITAIRRELAAFACSRQRLDLAHLFEVPTSEKTQNARRGK